MKVEVERKKVVKPSAPTPHHRRKLKLSSMDEPLTPNYTGIILYYADDAENSGVDIHQRLRRMEESLSEILTIFYPLAGRYIEDGGGFIDCNDHGVEFVHAKVDARIDRLLHGEPDPDLLDSLSRFPARLAGNPLVVIQANVFECGGVVIGLRMTHKIADMYTMAMFVNSWATACRGNMHEIVRPSFELSSIFPLKESSLATKPEPGISDESLIPLKESSFATGSEPRVSDEKLVTNRFRFDGKAISKLKSLATADAPESTVDNSPPSRVEVVSALISTVLVDIDRSKHGKPRPFVISITMNLREKIGLAVPANSFGNFATVLYADFGRAMADGTKLVFKEAVNVISEMLRNSRARYARVVGEELTTMVKDSLMEFMVHATSSEKHFIAFSSWCRFPLYEIDFGWGRPALVGLPPVSFRSVFLMDVEDNEGIDAWVTLKEDEMIPFKREVEIHAFTS